MINEYCGYSNEPACEALSQCYYWLVRVSLVVELRGGANSLLGNGLWQFDAK